jgi:hypothetical protein
MPTNQDAAAVLTQVFSALQRSKPMADNQQTSSVQSNARLQTLETVAALVKTPHGLMTLLSTIGVAVLSVMQVMSAAKGNNPNLDPNVIAMKATVDKLFTIAVSPAPPPAIPPMPSASYAPETTPIPKPSDKQIVTWDKASRLTLLLFDKGKSPATLSLLSELDFWKAFVASGNQFVFVDIADPQAAQWQPYYSKATLPSMVIMDSSNPVTLKWMATVPTPKNGDELASVVKQYKN